MNIFSKFFGHHKAVNARTSTTHNPWAGLSSYEDPEKSTFKLKFCGRDNDTYDVARLIDDNFFVTLYGKSGIGKTSLLNAGVFPALRREQYTPLSIRLGMAEEGGSFQQTIVAAIEHTLTERGGIQAVKTIPVVEEQTDIAATDYLWNYFARHRFFMPDGQPTFPVVVFDQFEEVFRNRRLDAEALLRQLNYLIDESHALNDCIVNSEEYIYDFNFRFVVSIREDDLYRLEDSIDNNYLPELKHCRFRLRSLTWQGAEAVILTPGEGLFKPEEQDKIVNLLIGDGQEGRPRGKARNEDGSISTNMLSLLCSRIFAEYSRSGRSHIDLPLVDTFMKGNPIERFYNEATRGFSNSEKSYIEDHFVDSTKRRNSVPESDFLLHVPKGAGLLEGDTRILQRISTSSDNETYRIELIHDSFCGPLAELRRKREQRRKMMAYASGAAIVLLCVGVTTLIFSQKETISQTEKELAEKADSLERANMELITKTDSLNQTTQLLEKEKTASEEKSRQLARALEEAQLANIAKENANRALAQKNEELALAITAFHTADWQKKGYESRALSAQALKLIEEDPYLACRMALEALPEDVSDPDRPVMPEAESLLREASLYHNTKIKVPHDCTINSESFSPDGKYIVTTSRDMTAIVWSTETGEPVDTLVGHKQYVYTATFSPDGKLIVTASDDKTAIIWSTETGEPIDTLEHRYYVSSAAFSPDGKHIVTISSGETAIVWSTETGEPVDTLIGYKKNIKTRIKSFAFSPDGKYIATTSRDNKTAILWSTEKGEPVDTLIGHKNGIYSVAFSPDGKNIVTTSLLDKTAIVWITETGVPVDTLIGHKDYVRSASFSPDGKYIVTASDDKTAILWSTEKGKPVDTLIGHKSSVFSAAFSPDGKYIVTISYDGTARIWDMNHLYGYKNEVSVWGRIQDVSMDSISQSLLVTQNGSPNIVKQHLGEERWQSIYVGNVYTSSFSPDGQHIIATCVDDNYFVSWDVDTPSEIEQCFYGHTGAINDISYSPDGTKIISASADSTVRIWDAVSGEEIEIFQEFDRGAKSARFSPNGEYIAATSDSCIILWDMGKGTEVFRHFYKYPGEVSFSPDSHYLTSTRNDSIIIWDTGTGKQVQYIFGGEETRVSNPIFSPDGNNILFIFRNDSFQSRVHIWDWRKRKEVKSLSYNDHVNAAYSSDGKQLVIAPLNGSNIEIWNTQTWICTDKIGTFSSGFLGIGFSPDDKSVIGVPSDNNYRTRVSIWKKEKTYGRDSTWKEKEYYNTLFNSAQFSRNGKFFVTASKDGKSVIWNTETGEPVDTLIGHKSYVYSAAFSPDGKYIVTASGGKAAIVWNRETGEPVNTLIGHKREVYSAAFSPDGKYIVTASADKTAIVWNRETGEPMDTLIGHKDYVYSAAFSLDGAYIVTASSDNTAIIWDTERGEPINTLIGHEDYVYSATFSPDGKYIVTASRDNTAKVWDVKRGKVIQNFKSPYCTHAFFAPDGKSIVTWSSQGVHVWDFPPLQELIDKNRKRFKNRPLTPDEKQKYNLE